MISQVHRELRRLTFQAWAAAHGMTWQWGAATLASWAAVCVFSAVTVPIKYPYEAVGTVVDSGIIVGLIVPVSVSGMILFEGPEDLVRLAARDLARPRTALLACLSAATGAAAAATAWASSLPVTVVTIDAVLLVALLAIGVSLLGVALGWLLPSLCIFIFSAPGLVPWEGNVLYRRDVSATYTIAVVVTLAASVIAYSLRGSRD